MTSNRRCLDQVWWSFSRVVQRICKFHGTYNNSLKWNNIMVWLHMSFFQSCLRFCVPMSMMILSRSLLLALKDMFVGRTNIMSMTSTFTLMSMAKVSPQWTVVYESKLLMEWNIMGFSNMLLSYAMLATTLHIRRYHSSLIGLIQSMLSACMIHTNWLMSITQRGIPSMTHMSFLVK